MTEAGVYDVEARVASDSTGGSFYVERGGVDATGPIAVLPTGGSQTWTTVRAEADLGSTLAAWLAFANVGDGCTHCCL